MRKFEFDMALSAQKTQAIYEGQARYILVETDRRLKLRYPLQTSTDTSRPTEFRVDSVSK